LEKGVKLSPETLLWQSIINGIAAGWIYILVAVGLALIFSIMGIVQLSHGEVYMLGAYCTYQLSVIYGLNYWMALLVSTFAAGILGVILERFFFRPFRDRFEPSLIIAIGLILLFQTAAMVGFDTSTKSIPRIFPGVLTAWGASISWERLVAIFFGIVLVLALFLMIRWTKTGQAMVAVSQDGFAAALHGINVDRISAIAMAIGCALAAIAGSLVGCIFTIHPHMGNIVLTKGIAVIILGGLGSIPGAVIGGLTLGLIDGLVSVISNTTIATIIGFTIIIFVLLLRPRGLFGRD
jgi:branched-chain amino acid transport system permease protein